MSSNYFDFLKQVRQNYIENWKGRRRQDPYKFGFQSGGMTIIENNVWNVIRWNCMEFYPQFPCGKYYIDFADPFNKIALEIDGKDHLREEVIKRDKLKEKFLNKNGWKVFRIEGWRTYKTYYDYFDSDRINEMYEDEIQRAQELYERTAEYRLLQIRDRYQPTKIATSTDEIEWITSREMLNRAIFELDNFQNYERRNKKLFEWGTPEGKYEYDLST